MNNLPKHIVIVMDGNGRWAKQRSLPRAAGHKAGAKTAKTIVEVCGKKGIEALTLFAFGRENWSRPKREVDGIMRLFINTLQKESGSLHKNNVQIRFIGDHSQLSDKLQESIAKTQEMMSGNTGLKLVVAINYSGRWDITNATRKLVNDVQAGTIQADDINSERLQSQLCLSDLPEPDLFIRTSGEKRISNFLLWQLAYTELYFTETHWPDFTPAELDIALADFTSRQRRFGCTGEQMEKEVSA